MGIATYVKIGFEGFLLRRSNLLINICLDYRTNVFQNNLYFKDTKRIFVAFCFNVKMNFLLASQLLP